MRRWHFFQPMGRLAEVKRALPHLRSFFSALAARCGGAACSSGVVCAAALPSRTSEPPRLEKYIALPIAAWNKLLDYSACGRACVRAPRPAPRLNRRQGDAPRPPRLQRHPRCFILTIFPLIIPKINYYAFPYTLPSLLNQNSLFPKYHTHFATLHITHT